MVQTKKLIDILMNKRHPALLWVQDWCAGTNEKELSLQDCIALVNDRNEDNVPDMLELYRIVSQLMQYDGANDD